jgi:hypothetical protein
MPRQNRVLPTGEIVADPARGTLTGNRGCLHDGEGRLRRRWTTKAWIACVLDWKGVRRQIMAPGRWTELFFLDEAVALAAGHRPCAFCRRADFRRFQAAWRGSPTAPEMDAALHAERLAERPVGRLAALPDGVLVQAAGATALKWQGRLMRFALSGYGPRVILPATVTVLTPAPMVAVLASGYRPMVHATATEAVAGERRRV